MRPSLADAGAKSQSIGASGHRSAALPPGDQYRQEVEWLLGTLGYRLVLRSLTHPPVVSPGGSLPIAMTWENLGVAPPYHWLGLALRLSPTSGSADPIVLPMAADVRAWVTGTVDVNEPLTVPATAAPGPYTLAVGMLGTPGIPMVNLAIEGRDAEGWYPVSSIEVQ